MIALIEEYQKELIQIACYAEDTVQNYVSCIVTFKFDKYDGEK